VRLVKFNLLAEGLHHLLEDPNGEVGQDLERRAQNVTRRVDVLTSGRPGPEIVTGDLNSSIHYVIVSDQNGLRAQIGTDQEHDGYQYPLGLETGIRPDTGEPTPHYPFLEPSLVEFDP
jgi:hypothetical protein